MSRKNGHAETYDDNVVLVTKVTELPYSYEPFDTYLGARAKYPDAKLYIYEGQAPAGWKIVAKPVQMVKPEEDEDEPVS